MPEELAQQQVLGVHGDVRLELALPPALRVLEADQGLDGSLQAAAGVVLDRRARPGRAPAASLGVSGLRSTQGAHRSRSVT